VPSVLVYRDVVGARSEAFVERQYSGFRTLKPLYVGTKRGPIAPKEAMILAAPGIAGFPARLAFRQFGDVPANLRRLLDDEKPAIVHAQFGLGGALALPIAERANVPLVVTFHGGDATKEKHFGRRPLLPTIFQRRREALATRAHTILCVSDYIRDVLVKRGFPAAKLVTHYLGIDIPQGVMLPPGGVSATVAFVGRLVEKKGADTLIDAMAIARQTDPTLDLLIVGDGPDKAALQKRAAAAGVRVRFAGWLAAKDVQTSLRRALLLAVPSRAAAGGDAEGLPTVIMEAMALGVPVVATRHAGIPEIVRDGVTGLLAPEADAGALAQAILALKADPGLASRLRGEAYVDIRTRFDAARQSVLLEQRLLEIIRSARNAI
jgi:glycosyltransferase involved in cell wall biosynthesis